jgi:hypothetical protein
MLLHRRRFSTDQVQRAIKAASRFFAIHVVTVATARSRKDRRVHLVLAGESNMTDLGSWSGVIINSICSAEEAFAEDPKCTQKDMPGGMLALYHDTTFKVYVLHPQDQAVGHLGDTVTITGTVEGNTLHVASLKMLTAIGLDVGRKAPAFSAHDQFGQQQSLETLKGPNGTVLLFFRSADW